MNDTFLRCYGQRLNWNSVGDGALLIMCIPSNHVGIRGGQYVTNETLWGVLIVKTR